MEEIEVKEKLKEYAAILNSLHTAGIVRTYNSPVGDYAEWIVSTKLNLLLEKNSKKGYDAIDEANGISDHVEGHHILDYQFSGAADKDNIIALCHKHHNDVHKGFIGLLKI